MKAQTNSIFHILLFTFLSISLLGAALFTTPAGAIPPVRFAKPGGVGTGTCDTWETACNLHYALSQAVATNEVWVKGGVYTPTTGLDQSLSFQIQPGVTVYGGFAGTETLLSQRNPVVNVTILSGDIDSNDAHALNTNIDVTTSDIHGANSYHVVTMDGTGASTITTSTAMDAFIITGGESNANGGGFLCEGGASGKECSPSLSNITFSGNLAAVGDGGAMYNDARSGGTSNPILNNINFSGNFAKNGGAMFNDAEDNGTSNPVLRNVTFDSNNASYYGGAMYNHSLNVSGSSSHSDPTLTNVTFHHNSATSYNGGAMNNFAYGTGSTSSPTLTNVTFQDNSALVGGAMGNNGNSSGISSPTLTNVTFSGNTAQFGGAIYNEITTGTSNPSLKNVILWGDMATNGVADGPEIYNNGATTTINYSIVQGGNAGSNTGTAWSSGTGNLKTDPKLNSLGVFGGFNKTMTLQMGSTAIDHGTNAGCPASDQRGIARPQDGNGDGVTRCDMGATESRWMKAILPSAGNYDGWVLESSENSSVGGTKDNAATTFRLGDDALNKQYRSMLSFNTAMPSNASIVSVTLKIKKAGLVGHNPFSTLGNVLVDVRKGAFNGNNTLQTGDFQAAASKSAAMTITNTPVLGWYSKALTSANFSYLNKAGVTQMRLRFAAGDNNNHVADYLTFYSGNFTTVSSRPQLVVQYYVP